MDKSVLSKYKQPEEKLILSKLLDKVSFCETRNSIQVTDFLDLAQKQLITKFLQSQKITNYIFYGGFEEAERQIVILYPKKLENLIKEEKIDFGEWVKVIRITLPNENKGEYTHRNYLRSINKTWIKREKIGDILVDEDGADIIVSSEILKFLLNNLEELTRFQKAKIEEIPLLSLRKVKIEKEEIIITVSSMRLDNIVAELANCSRSKANEILMRERVFINSQNITKPTKEIKENDKITIRGKGRFEIKEIVGNTRKGKIIIKVEKNI